MNKTEMIKKTVKDMNGITAMTTMSVEKHLEMVKIAYNEGWLTHEEFNPTLGTMDYFKGNELMIRVPIAALG